MVRCSFTEADGKGGFRFAASWVIQLQWTPSTDKKCVSAMRAQGYFPRANYLRSCVSSVMQSHCLHTKGLGFKNWQWSI